MCVYAQSEYVFVCVSGRVWVCLYVLGCVSWYMCECMFEYESVGVSLYVSGCVCVSLYFCMCQGVCQSVFLCVSVCLRVCVCV